MSQLTTPFVLSEADQTTLNQLVSKGKESVGKLNRASALQFSDQGQHHEQISNLLGISVATVYNLRKRYGQQGLLGAIGEKSRPGQPRKVTQQVEAQITQLEFYHHCCYR